MLVIVSVTDALVEATAGLDTYGKGLRLGAHVWSNG